MGNKKLNLEVKQLYSAADKLEKENYDLWRNDVAFQGHGFKISLKETWVDVWLSLYVTGPSEAVVTLYKRNEEYPNYFDSFACKKLAEETTTDLSKVYDIVKKLVGQKIKEEKDMLYQLQRQRTAGAYITIQTHKTHTEAVEHLARIALQENPDRPYDGGDKWQNSSNVHNVNRYRIVPLEI